MLVQAPCSADAQFRKSGAGSSACRDWEPRTALRLHKRQLAVLMRCGKRVSHLLRHFYRLLNVIIYRDRLGTNVGKTQEEMRFSQGASAAQAWCENSLLLKFVVLEHGSFPKTGLGQTSG